MPTLSAKPLRRAVVAVALVLGVTACQAADAVPPPAAGPFPVRHVRPGRAPAPAVPVTVGGMITFPEGGPGQFRYASVEGPVAGTSGQLLRYRVAVEDGIGGVEPDAFATDVRTILGNPRGWTAGGHRELQQVAGDAPADFTIFLVTPDTRDHLCSDQPDGYTSCRNGDSVVLNVARWANSVPGFGAPLSVYRQYMVGHETGHRLGFGHQLCPGPGQPAPIMQQQTLGLHGCVANPWPFVDGKPYLGVNGEYDDPIPAEAR